MFFKKQVDRTGKLKVKNEKLDINVFYHLVPFRGFRGKKKDREKELRYSTLL